jgi:hypothetical protein
LDIGDGNIKARVKNGESEPSWITVPDDLLLMTNADKLQCLANTVYPDLQAHYLNAPYLTERAILAPTNDITEVVNDYIVSLIPGETREYYSSDSIANSSVNHESYEMLYPVEFLNSLNGNNSPP